MAALLISLKISLLRGTLRTSVSQRVGFAVAALFGAGVAVGGAIGLCLLRAASAPWAAFGVLVVGSVLVAGWAVVPLLVSGVDETLDPARFALLPLRARQLTPGLLAAGLVGVPGVVTSVLAAATVVTWSRGLLPVVLAVPAAVLGVLTCVLVSRLLTTAAARLLAGRRSRELGALVAVLMMSSIGLWPTLLSRGGAPATADAEHITQLLGWTPFGLPWAAPADAATGHPLRGVLRLVLAAALLVAGAAAWSALLDRALTEQADASGGTRSRVGASLLDRLPARPVWAITTRCLRYWRRDPRYLVAAGAITVSSVVPLIAISSQGRVPAAFLGAGAYSGALFGITTSNDIGYDGSAFATHLMIGVRGRIDRLGRALAATLWTGPLVLVWAVAGAVLSGRPQLWPASVGAGLGALLGGVGTASVAGALVAYPVPEAGSNPFRSSSGGGARAAMAQLATMAVTGTVALPGIALLVAAAVWWPPAAWIGLVVGPAVGVGVATVGIVVGGRLIDARGPEILASVRRPQ